MNAACSSFNAMYAVWIIGAYLIGAIAFGIIASKLFGLPDPRTIGSGNIGATNVARSGKKGAALFTLIGDIFKGWLPVWLATNLHAPTWVVAAIAAAVFFGHLFPIYFNFKGGKGVATAYGIMLALSPLLGLATFITWILVFLVSRYSSLAAIITAAFSPVFAWFFIPESTYILVIFVMATLLIWRHKTNIERLVAGTEAGFGKK